MKGHHLYNYTRISRTSEPREMKDNSTILARPGMVYNKLTVLYHLGGQRAPDRY